ncbi:alpha/beta hydrolase [Albibacterium sp.]|uniref:alpha/beta hydrolase n=1 Tax=Albibacterium sp. TaxID=2952885 RepID=UPI002B8EF0FA|nr:alpha/beta hydrolase [Albibacterium sp.]HUH19677.1 alpha/beta hydrolase [Albibacterium sp.]
MIIFTIQHLRNPEGVFIFIHGGYWQGEVKKESYAFVAKKLLERNIDVILIEYDLTKENEKFGEQIPRVSMTAIVNELGTALDKIQVYLSNTFKESMSKIPVYVSGHSAGGHLAAMLKDHPLITGAVMPISGIFDLIPVSKTKKIGQALQLNLLEASKLSPINNLLPAMDHSALCFCTMALMSNQSW